MIGQYLEVKGLTKDDLGDFCASFKVDNPEPPGSPSSPEHDHWSRAREVAWAEVVNQRLLPENVVGACVVGGLFMAACSLRPAAVGLLGNLFAGNEDTGVYGLLEVTP